mmetsp:Transcript_742/g.1984  ORF Transcript_742/g.1984 Transcript_742/m.1984 type:complete len:257 (-) Transcript_742:50-820(-)
MLALSARKATGGSVDCRDRGAARDQMAKMAPWARRVNEAHVDLKATRGYRELLVPRGRGVTKGQKVPKARKEIRATRVTRDPAVSKETRATRAPWVHKARKVSVGFRGKKVKTVPSVSAEKQESRASEVPSVSLERSVKRVWKACVASRGPKATKVRGAKRETGAPKGRASTLRILSSASKHWSSMYCLKTSIRCTTRICKGRIFRIWGRTARGRRRQRLRQRQMMRRRHRTKRLRWHKETKLISFGELETERQRQ